MRGGGLKRERALFEILLKGEGLNKDRGLKEWG